jgi:hypothetical protein
MGLTLVIAALALASMGARRRTPDRPKRTGGH